VKVGSRLRLGFHISIAGGLSKVLKRAEAKRCQTIQLFSRNPRGWKYRSLDEKEAGLLRGGILDSNIGSVFLHMPYLANLATPDRSMFNKSVESLSEELRRAPLIGADYVVIHVGRRLHSTEKSALSRVASGMNAALCEVGNSAGLLLEITSGMGTEIGYRFSQIGRIIDRVEQKERVGVCLDTAHAFEAGYDLSSEEGLEESITEFEKEIGLNRLKLIHLNDSRTSLGSRVDRHWHIGKGFIGMKGMRRLINYPELSGLPAIMETPRKSDREDLTNLRVAVRLSG